LVTAQNLAVSLDVRPVAQVDAAPQPAGHGQVKVAVTRAADPA
jgi:hypothetical protein